VSQPEEGLKSLRERAKELELHLIEVPSTGFSEIKLGIAFSFVVDDTRLFDPLTTQDLRASIRHQMPASR
jgi:hypothetical protein